MKSVKKIVSIHQPDYIPYIGYFFKIFKADYFVFLDDAQYSNNNRHQCNFIKTPQGKYNLKIPVKYNFGDEICNVHTRENLMWKEKHLKTILYNYSNAKYFNDFFMVFRELLLSKYSNLAELNIEINKYIAKRFGFSTKFYLSSEIGVHTKNEERLLDICQYLEGEIYYSGNGAKIYQDIEHFENRGIKLYYSEYKPVEYHQLWNGFLSNLSIIDYIFNRGFDWEYIERSIM